MLDFVQKWKDKVRLLVDTKVRLMQLDLIEKTSQVMSQFVLILMFIFIGFGCSIFFGFGLAEFFATLWENRIAGFMSAAMLFVLLGAVVYSYRKKITDALTNRFIEVMTEQKEDQDNPQAE